MLVFQDGALLAQAKLLENTARIIESMSAQLSTARGGRGGGEGGLPGDNATMRRRRERKRASRTWMDRPVLVNVSDSGAIRSISAGIMPLEGEAAPRRRSGSRKKRGGKEATNNRPLSKAALFDLVLSKLQVYATCTPMQLIPRNNFVWWNNRRLMHWSKISSRN
jgi:hypothetical protein